MGSVRQTRLAAAQVPGVYYSPRTREPESPFTRTDVAGFVGFVPATRRSGAISDLRQPVRCDDWQDYVLSVSHAPEPRTMARC